jgi:flagellar biosynthesis/type III secretory pathway M-ring protein FliF/YscJ
VNSPADNGPALPASVGQVEAALAAKQPAQILDMARSNPAATAVVVKQWLKSNA